MSCFEEYFVKIECPVFICVNCLCNYCRNNVEGKISQKEYCSIAEEKLCFHCDTCKQHTGNLQHQVKNITLCTGFSLSDYGIQTNKKRLKQWNKAEKRKQIIQTFNGTTEKGKYKKKDNNRIDGQLDLFSMLE